MYVCIKIIMFFYILKLLSLV